MNRIKITIVGLPIGKYIMPLILKYAYTIPNKKATNETVIPR